MSVGSDFKTYIKTISAVTDLIGSGTSARIFDRRGKQDGESPWILYFAGGGEVEQDVGGLAGAAQTILHVWCFGTSSDNADTLDSAVRSAMVGSTGLDGRGTMGSTSVLSMSVSSPFWGEDNSRDNDDDYEPFVRRVYTIWHLEATT